MSLIVLRTPDHKTSAYAPSRQEKDQAKLGLVSSEHLLSRNIPLNWLCRTSVFLAAGEIFLPPPQRQLNQSGFSRPLFLNHSSPALLFFLTSFLPLSLIHSSLFIFPTPSLPPPLS
ncbi:hypothetical protein BDW75DRAFT_67924 [Aspergillus navahoensis]